VRRGQAGAAVVGVRKSRRGSRLNSPSLVGECARLTAASAWRSLDSFRLVLLVACSPCPARSTWRGSHRAGGRCVRHAQPGCPIYVGRHQLSCPQVRQLQLHSLGLDLISRLQVFYWDVSTGRTIRRFRGHDSAVNSVTFGATETVLVTGGYDQVRGLVQPWYDLRLRPAWEGTPRQAMVEVGGSEGSRLNGESGSHGRDGFQKTDGRTILS